MGFEIEFYSTSDGKEPIADFLDGRFSGQVQP